jgi:hypothetical protein
MLFVDVKILVVRTSMRECPCHRDEMLASAIPEKTGYPAHGFVRSGAEARG